MSRQNPYMRNDRDRYRGNEQGEDQCGCNDQRGCYDESDDCPQSRKQRCGTDCHARCRRHAPCVRASCHHAACLTCKKRRQTKKPPSFFLGGDLYSVFRIL